MGHFDASVAGSDALHPHVTHAVAGAEHRGYGPGESHLGGFAGAEEVLDVLIEMWDGVRPTISVPA